MVDKINCWSISKQGQIELSPMMRRCHPTTQSILNSDLYSGVCAVCVYVCAVCVDVLLRQSTACSSLFKFSCV